MSGGLTGGEIAAICLAALFGILLIVIIIVCCVVQGKSTNIYFFRFEHFSPNTIMYNEQAMFFLNTCILNSCISKLHVHIKELLSHYSTIYIHQIDLRHHC